MLRLHTLLFLGLLLFPRFGYGQTELDLTATEMEKHLIAPCCWSKTLDQEQSEVAIYMKQKIKQQLALGKSVDEIYGMFEEEFGERVLAQPKKSGFNWLVWIFPLILMPLGMFVLLKKLNLLTNHSESTTETMQSDIKNTVSSEDQKYIDQIDQELYRS